MSSQKGEFNGKVSGVKEGNRKMGLPALLRSLDEKKKTYSYFASFVLLQEASY